MSSGDLLAHSPRGSVPGQAYVEHVKAVLERARENASRAVSYYSGDRDTFLEQVLASAAYHDLGKLDEANQAVLRKRSLKPLPVAHEDAGVEALKRLGRQESVVLVAAHHAGLFSREAEMGKQGKLFRRLDIAQHVEDNLNLYLKCHAEAGCPLFAESNSEPLRTCGFTRRVALSCLVDADHGDTARHYAGETGGGIVETRWADRLKALDKYVNRLPSGTTQREKERNKLRSRLYQACRDASIDPRIRTCDAPVGTGKTTAVMAHLLRVAASRNLRHIIVVLPYTNIVSQAVGTYRRALVLDGERPEEVVAEHHHRAEFECHELRHLAILWKAPLIVTTAVQFFETIGSCNPARLRKLHELPGSAVFVDEMHASIPSHLWPQVWRWLEVWTRDWGGHIVLASGSLPRFWELPGYRELIWPVKVSDRPEVIDLVTDVGLRADLKTAEEKRIRYRRRKDEDPALDLSGLIEMVCSHPGPRLLIVNTIQTAAVIALAFRNARKEVLHLSTALAPAHREPIIGKVKQKLREGAEDWTLVATSCVEAGMDFSFRTGFRERASAASLIQIGGRVSRGDEHKDAEVWDILLRDDGFRSNPQFTVSRQALDRIHLDELNVLGRSELATRAMRDEWTYGSEDKARELVEAEKKMEYPTVAKLCRVIEADSRTVIVDGKLVEALRQHRKVSKLDLLRYSVEIRASRLNALRLKPIDQAGDLYLWPYDYDREFLGYMAGVLALTAFLKDAKATIL